jgi:hypothetical protein
MQAPPYTSGLTLWLDPQSLADLADGANVASWLNNADPTASPWGGSGFPVLRHDVANGRPALFFDGVDDFLISGASDPLSDYIANNNGSFYVAFRTGAISTDDATLANNVAILATETTQRVGLYLESDPIVRAVNVDAGGADSVTLAVTVGDWHVACWVHSGGNLYLALDNPLALASVASGNTSVLTNRVRLGVNPGATAFFFGFMGDVLAYDVGHFGAADGSGELDLVRAQIVNWLKSRWTDRGNAEAQARDVGSRRLYDVASPRLFVEQEVPLELMDQDLLSDVAVSHPLGLHPTGAGWGNAAWQRRPMRRVAEEMDDWNHRLKLRLADLRRPL